MSWPEDNGGIGGSSGAAPIVATWAARPSATNNSSLVRFSDVGGGTVAAGGGSLFYSNGTRWKPVNGGAILDAVDTANTSVANTTEQQLNPNHAAIPAGVIGDFDRLRLKITLSKSSNADTSTIRLRYGPLGTVADPIIITITSLAAANQSYGAQIDFKRVSATSLQKLGNADPSTGFNGAVSSTVTAPVAVSSMDTNIMYLTISSQMTTGTETVSLVDFTLFLDATDSQ